MEGKTDAELREAYELEMRAMAALSTVMDPELGLSVVELALIRSVEITPERVLISSLLTTPFCPYAPEMIASMREAVGAVFSQPVEVKILAERWNPADAGMESGWW
jgi:metal-sulfur cluster biosynthetic enzyme